MITRRDFVAGTSALALAVALTNVASLSEAFAQANPSKDDLAKAGPLGDQVMGKDDAPVTVIEYASMTCSHCANFATKIFPEFKKRWVDTGKAKYILREFPLDPLSAGAFMLARCAGNDKYYPLVETLFAQQAQWVVQKPIEPLLNIARQAGFSQQTFDTCLKDQKMLESIEQVRNHATEKLGVNSTPTFFINGKKFTGVMQMDDLEKAIEPLLKG